MKKEWKRISCISLIILLLSSFLSIFILNMHFVSAQEPETLGKAVAGAFSDFFSNWATGTGISDNAAKILFLIMIALILFLIFNGLFSDYNQTIVVALSIIVAFLATAYITPAEIFQLIQSYTALGLTLGSLVPFAVLLALSYRAATAASGGVQLWMLQKFAWIFFALYSLYKLISYPFISNGITNWEEFRSVGLNYLIQTNPTTIILLFVTIIACIMAIFDRFMLRWIARSYLLYAGDSAQHRAAAAATINEILANELRAMGGRQRGVERHI